MIRQILFLALTMSVLGAIAQEPAPPKANAEMQQWLETVEAQWQAALSKEATTPLEDEKAKLVQQYSAAIETNLNKASSAGNLDLAVLWRNERDRFAGAKEVPADDDATTTPELKQLRVAWRAQMARLEKDRTERTKAVQVRYDQVLEKAQTQFTQQQRLDEAVMVKNKREQIAARGPGPQVPATAPATADVPAQSGVPAGLVGTWRVRWPQNGWQATRTISGDGKFTSSDGGPGTWKLVDNTLVLQFRNYQETFDLPLKPGGTKV
ncbi:MAG TPA: hypothetical protein VK968_00415, partial [Roseimicrobium sp.]|nr:hypothetical protein [Roseimicrobium sp.]